MNSSIQLSSPVTSEDSTRHVRPVQLGYRVSARDSWISLVLFLISCSYLMLFYDYTNLNGDEGIVLQGTQRILMGQVLYRDFFSFYTPGSYYSTALLFKMFGDSILVARATLVLCGGLFSALTYLLARRVSSVWSSLLAVYLLTVICIPFRFLVSHWDSTLFAYLGLYCGLVWVERRRWQWAFITGLLVFLTCLFEQAKGAGLLVGLILGILIINLRRPDDTILNKPSTASFAAGAILPLVLTISYFAGEHALPQMLADWIWPVFHYSKINKVPYGFFMMSPKLAGLVSGNWASKLLLLMIAGPLILIPLLPILALGIFSWSLCKRPAEDDAWPYRLFISSCLSGVLFSVLLTGRADFTHLVYVAPLFGVVVAWVIDGLLLRTQIWRAIMPVVFSYFMLSSTVFGGALLWPALTAHTKLRTARGTVRIDPGDISLQYVQARVTPGEEIFVYPYEPLYYYLTGTFSPTRFDFLQLGMHTPDQFQDSLQSLSTQRPHVVLFETSFLEKLSWTSPHIPLQVIAARDPVEEYIFSHYVVCSPLLSNSYWRFLFMVRKDQPCPGNAPAPLGIH